MLRTYPTVLAKVTPGKENTRTKVSEENQSFGERFRTLQNTICVTGISRVLWEPDAVEFCMKVESTKDSSAEARNSVIRRLEYLLQAVRNHNIKEKDLVVHKMLRKEDGLFLMSGEVFIHCSSLDQYEGISSQCAEKLDGTVTVSEPVLRHSNAHMESGRKEAASLAARDARQKAEEFVRSTGQAIGPAILVQEEETTEIPVTEYLTGAFRGFLQRQKAVFLQCKISVIYQLVLDSKSEKK